MKSILHKKTTLFLFTVLLTGTIFTACSDIAGPNNDEDISQRFLRPPEQPVDPVSDDECIPEISGSSTLKASNSSYDAGSVDYKIEDDNLIVTYVAAGGVGIFETHLWVGMDLSDMPSAGRGQPVNGRFPYGDKFSPATDIAEYVIPLSSIDGYDPDEQLFIVAHAVVQGSSIAEFSSKETAYAGDNKGNSPRWWWYIAFDQEDECIPDSDSDEPDAPAPGDDECVIVDAFGSSVLKASNSSHNAGSVDYKIEGGNLVVTYVAADGVGIRETHLWVGTNLNDMPSAGRGQPVNGRFPYGDKFSPATNVAEYVIPVSSINGYGPDSELFIVAHAVVQGSSSAEFSSKETAYAGDNKGNSPRWWWYIVFDQEEACI